MPTESEVVQGLIEGLERQSNKGDIGTHIDVKGGTAVADRNSTIYAPESSMDNATVNVETNVVATEFADDAIVHLEILKEEIETDNPDEGALEQIYSWFESNIPLVAATLSTLESIQPIVPS